MKYCRLLKIFLHCNNEGIFFFDKITKLGYMLGFNKNKRDYKEKVVVKYGGSLLVPEDIDVETLKNFMVVAKKLVKENSLQIFLVVGGGYTNRLYNEALANFSHIDNNDLDWMGIYSTKLNAEMVKLALGEEWAHQEVINDPIRVEKEINEPFVICSPNGPGRSSNYVAVEFAKAIGSLKIVNLSDVDYVYNKNPKEYPGAVRLEEISWDDYLKIIPGEWVPKMSVPFDPVAARKAKEFSLKVLFADGKNTDSLVSAILDEENFKGTVLGY